MRTKVEKAEEQPKPGKFERRPLLVVVVLAAIGWGRGDDTALGFDPIVLWLMRLQIVLLTIDPTFVLMAATAR